LLCVKLRTHDQVLDALELAVTMAHRSPYAAQIVITAARTAHGVLESHRLEGRLSALESVLGPRRIA